MQFSACEYNRVGYNGKSFHRVGSYALVISLIFHNNTEAEIPAKIHKITSTFSYTFLGNIRHNSFIMNVYPVHFFQEFFYRLRIFYNFLVTGRRFACKLRKSYVNSSWSFGELNPFKNPKAAFNSFANHKTRQRAEIGNSGERFAEILVVGVSVSGLQPETLQSRLESQSFSVIL